MTLLICSPLWHNVTDTPSGTHCLKRSLQQYNSDTLWHALGQALWHDLSDPITLKWSLIHDLSDWIPLRLSLQLDFLDTISWTGSLLHNVSDMISLIRFLLRSLSRMIFLIWSLCHDLSDMISLACTIWYSNSHKQNEHLTRNSLSDNTRKVASIFHYQTLVHSSVWRHLPLESICLNGVYER